jgi:TfoX/Sxy family transcriptional regulator of competence genes
VALLPTIAVRRNRGSGPAGHALVRRLGPQGSSPRRTIASVAYDEELADRIRELLDGEASLTEKKMFGGLAFLVGGNMAVAASGQGGLLVRVDPAQSEELVAAKKARLMEMGGRSMHGWLRVDSDAVRTRGQLARWVKLGVAYALSLPTKR